MIRKERKISSIMSFILLCFVFLMNSCVHDDSTNCCELKKHILTVTLDGSDSIASINDILLYIFDENDNFLEVRTAFINTPIEVDYPAQKKLHVVALANTQGSSLKIPAFHPGDPLSSGYVQLTTDSLSGNLIANSPSNLYFGNAQVDLSGNAVTGRSPDQYTVSILLTRKVCQMKFFLDKLHEYVGSTDTNGFSILIGQTPSVLNFDGTFTGSLAHYSIPCVYDPATGTFSTPLFYTYPSDLNAIVYFRLYKDGKLIYEVDSSKAPELALNSAYSASLKMDFSAIKADGSVDIIFAEDWWSENQTQPF